MGFGVHLPPYSKSRRRLNAKLLCLWIWKERARTLESTAWISKEGRIFGLLGVWGMKLYDSNHWAVIQLVNKTNLLYQLHLYGHKSSPVGRHPFSHSESRRLFHMEARSEWLVPFAFIVCPQICPHASFLILISPLSLNFLPFPFKYTIIEFVQAISHWLLSISTHHFYRTLAEERGSYLVCKSTLL